MSLFSDPLFWLVALVAVTAQGLSKGGFAGLGTFAVPVMALVISPLQALGILLPILLVQDVVTTWSYRRDWDGWNLAVLIPGQIVGAGLGWLAASYVSDAQIRLAVGAVVVLFTLNYWFGIRPSANGKRPPVARGLALGTVSGVTGFLAHSGAPPIQIFLLPQRLPKQRLVATISMLFLSNNLLKVVPYFWLGQLSSANISVSLLLLPFAIATSIFGVWLVRRTSTEAFFRIVYVLLFVVGAELIRNGLTALLVAHSP
jgi:uncharacterized membrane protein YfcA